MGDMADEFAALKAVNRQIKEQRKVENSVILHDFICRHKVNYVAGDHTVLIRDSRFPAIDVYVTTGKWKHCPSKLVRSGIERMIKYLEKVKIEGGR